MTTLKIEGKMLTYRVIPDGDTGTFFVNAWIDYDKNINEFTDFLAARHVRSRALEGCDAFVIPRVFFRLKFPFDTF